MDVLVIFPVDVQPARTRSSPVRAAEINNCPKIAPDSGSDSRRGKGRIIVLCNPCRNTEAEPEDQQDWMIICFRGLSIRCLNGIIGEAV